MLIAQQKLNTLKIKDLIFNRWGPQKLKDIIQTFIPSQNKYIYWVGSGRCALRYILENIKLKHCFKDAELRVGLPGFTCHVVLDSILRAKCKPVFIDSKEVISIPNLKKSISKIGALILPYNFGFLPDFDKIQKICKKNNIILIEDCAQALGSSFKGQLAGSFGDYSFYSFGISKNIGFLGGLILSKDKLNILPTSNYPISKVVNISLRSILSNLFFSPYIYKYANLLLKSELQKQQEPLDYKLPKLCQRVVTNMFENYESVLNVRISNAKLAINELRGVIDFIEPIKNSNPSWLYFVLLPKNRSYFIKKLKKENVEIMPLLTYKDLSKKGILANKIEKQNCCFALYRPRWEIEFIIKKIKKVCKNKD